jgi:hypothetical protein
MADDPGSSRRRPVDPLVAGVGEGVAAGYRALELVLDGLGESMRRNPRAADPGESRARRAGIGSAPPAGEADADLAELIADVLGRVADSLKDVSEHVRVRQPGALPPERPALGLRGPAGTTVTDEFRITNTGASALREIKFEVTDLLGAAAKIPADAVTVDFPGGKQVARLRPRGSAAPTVTVAIPADTHAGMYRGVIAARVAAAPGREEGDTARDGAWALLELEVIRTDRRPGKHHEEKKKKGKKAKKAKKAS